MKKMINSVHFEGYLYQHDLVKKVTGPTSKVPGTEYITGNIEIVVDEDGLNVVPVHFTYVTEKTAKGGTNATFTTLSKIIDGGKTWIADGKDAAVKVKVDTSIALNDFYTENNGQVELVSAKRCEGGFVTIVSALDPNKRDTFSVDMVITNVARVDANEEKNIPEYVNVRGAIFNFKNDVLPVEFSVKDEGGMNYFEDLGVTASEPVFTQVRGAINNISIKQTITREAAFGEAAVDEVTRTYKEWVITWAQAEPYEFGADGVLTADELTKAMGDRQVMLAEKKKQYEDYKAEKAKGGNATPVAQTAAPSAAAPAGKFSF